MIELIVSDMDGTLLNDKMEVSASNVSAINEAKRLGIKFMVATGRGYTEAVPALKEVGIDCPMITLNGGQVFDEDGQLVENLGIDKTNHTPYFGGCQKVRSLLRNYDIQRHFLGQQGAQDRGDHFTAS